MTAGNNVTCVRIFPKEKKIVCWGQNLFNMYSQEGITANPEDFNGNGGIEIKIGIDQT